MFISSRLENKKTVRMHSLAGKGSWIRQETVKMRVKMSIFRTLEDIWRYS